MGIRSRLAALLLVALALLPVEAGDNDVYVRIVQVKATGTRGEKRAAMDESLEPFRAHLERASKHARYTMLGRSEVKHGTFGRELTFELENRLRAAATASAVSGKKIQLVLQVNKRAGKKDDLVFETTLDMKDGATAVPVIEKALEGGDLLLAVTASRESL